MSEKPKKQNNQQNSNKDFLKEVAKYFMDFLETDFHKRRSPKRRIKLHNEDGLLLGINLNKYPTFNKAVWKEINKGFAGNKLNKVEKGVYKTQIPESLLDVITKQTENISNKQIKDLLQKIDNEINNFSKLHKANYEKTFEESMDYILRAVKSDLISPFIESLKESLMSMKLGDENTIYLMEEESAEILTQTLRAKVSEITKSLIAEQKINSKKELSSVFDANSVKGVIVEFFENYRVTDLFSEIYEINRNKNILDKQEFYLNFCEISFNKAKYPIFYIPLELQKNGNAFDVTFDSQVYVNKRALEYIKQEFNKETGKRGKLQSISERILYLAQYKGGDFSDHMSEIIAELINSFGLNNEIVLSNPEPQSSRSSLVKLSNTCYISLFDKSDEALVNDYEGILELLDDSESDLGADFSELINKFIHEEPTSFIAKVEDDWDETEVEERLVFNSPIPLNSEQRQILSALSNNEDCKYIIVEGPPGTGKSHTITAMVFNAILNNQSVLVLSDKKEALDVVENKITETMNKVRLDSNFQNPILRLGKTGSTYRQILTKGSIDNIKTHYRAVKKDYETLEKRIEESSDALKLGLANEISAYNEVDMLEVQELCVLEDYYEKNKDLIDEKEVFEQRDAALELEEFRSIFFSLRKKLCGQIHNNALLQLLDLSIRKFGNLENFQGFLNNLADLQDGANDVLNEFEKGIDLLAKFKEFKDEDLKHLKGLISKYEDSKLWIFGYLFSKKKLDDINRQFKEYFPGSKYKEPHKTLDELNLIVDVFEYSLKFKNSVLEKFSKSLNYLNLIHKLLTNPEILNATQEMINLDEDIKYLNSHLNKYPNTLKKVQIDLSDFATFCENKMTKMTSDDFNKLIRYVSLKQKVKDDFDKAPNIKYLDNKEDLESLLTTQMTYLMDERVINFYESSAATASVLRDIIKSKEKFPTNKFKKLKAAFPCILAGIRDYAEYIPLESEMFDLLIIDEASQVGIAQAFPALLRAKKIVVLGDKLQFSNVKSYQAANEINNEYLNSLKKVFKEKVSTDPTDLKKLEYFNIKKSILDFFEFIRNYEMMLKKHFRGYKENISFSNKYFYQEDLQVMKIRGKKIDDVLKFSFIEHDNKKELKKNTNMPEIDYIIERLKELKDAGDKQTVGIITPHTNQQRLCNEVISKLPEGDYYFDELKLKIMTFDTCQGEERDTIFYSMVATEEDDMLWSIFPKILSSNTSEESEDNLRRQRLNVGFSRSRECMHFVMSKSLDKYSGAIGESIRHYFNTLEDAKREKNVSEVDERSKMEPLVLNWFYQTSFWKNNKDSIEFNPQFEIGKYLRQLDKTYNHPNYKVDFLINYTDPKNNVHKIIIEYDGFQEHFVNREEVNILNYQKYLSADDIYRQKVLESYGYQFIRINKFNSGDDPIATLDERIGELFQHGPVDSSFIKDVHETVKGLQAGEMKECSTCNEIKILEEFYDSKLSSGYGRKCKSCKGSKDLEEFIEEIKEGGKEEKICPQCSAKMILRSGRYGKFYGCSKYPYCKGTRQY